MYTGRRKIRRVGTDSTGSSAPSRDPKGRVQCFSIVRNASKVRVQDTDTGTSGVF
jgi:hypothetical protein